MADHMKTSSVAVTRGQEAAPAVVSGSESVGVIDRTCQALVRHSGGQYLSDLGSGGEMGGVTARGGAGSPSLAIIIAKDCGAGADMIPPLTATRWTRGTRVPARHTVLCQLH